MLFNLAKTLPISYLTNWQLLEGFFLIKFLKKKTFLWNIKMVENV